jgi:DNA-binding NarL/FixJ family response regulator
VFGAEHFYPSMVPVTERIRGQRLTHVRVLVADDNPDIMEHVSAMLPVEYEIVGRVVEGKSVCDEVERLKPALVVLDISVGDCSGIEIARHLREQGYAGEIVFLTVHEDPDFVSAAIGAGGRGYVTKSRMNVDLRLAVKAVLSHRIFISAPLQDE